MTSDKAPIEYEFDVLDELILSIRGYMLAHEQFAEAYERYRRLYTLESYREAVETYPQLFGESYGAVMLFKRKVEAAIEKYRLEPCDQEVRITRNCGNINAGEKNEFTGVTSDGEGIA
jgi:hypothetical protein